MSLVSFFFLTENRIELTVTPAEHLQFASRKPLPIRLRHSLAHAPFSSVQCNAGVRFPRARPPLIVSPVRRWPLPRCPFPLPPRPSPSAAQTARPFFATLAMLGRRLRRLLRQTAAAAAQFQHSYISVCKLTERSQGHGREGQSLELFCQLFCSPCDIGFHLQAR